MTTSSVAAAAIFGAACARGVGVRVRDGQHVEVCMATLDGRHVEVVGMLPKHARALARNLRHAADALDAGRQLDDKIHALPRQFAQLSTGEIEALALLSELVATLNECPREDDSRRVFTIALSDVLNRVNVMASRVSTVGPR